MYESLNNKIALVTGAGTSIGQTRRRSSCRSRFLDKQ